MVVLLPLLMAEVLIGQEIHEWLGTGMLALFIAHHILNFGWWKSFVKGKYTPSRAFGTALDLLLLADMIALFVSGIMMSGFVFRFLHISGGRFGQSLTAITKLAPDAVMGEPLPIHYSGGGSMPDDVAAWLETNKISIK